MNLNFLKPWDQLSIERRGWAFGSIFGLLVSGWYFWGITQFRTAAFRYPFSLLALPAFPGIWTAESALGSASLNAFLYFFFKSKIYYSLIASVFNYLFWGFFFALLYRYLFNQKKFNALNLFFAFFGLFWSTVGMSFSLNVGVNLTHISPGVIFIFISLFLGMISLGYIFFYILHASKLRPD